MAKDSHTRTVKILHFDDEPETVDWIPEALLNHYWDLHPEWIREDDISREEDDEHNRVKFCLQYSEHESIVIDYHICRTPETFSEVFAPSVDDLVILDVMCERPDGSLEPVGAQLYKDAVQHLSVDRVYILTAYPRRLEEALGEQPPSGQLYTKPADAARIVEMIAKKLEHVFAVASE